MKSNLSMLFVCIAIVCSSLAATGASSPPSRFVVSPGDFDGDGDGSEVVFCAGRSSGVGRRRRRHRSTASGSTPPLNDRRGESADNDSALADGVVDAERWSGEGGPRHTPLVVGGCAFDGATLSAHRRRCRKTPSSARRESDKEDAEVRCSDTDKEDRGEENGQCGVDESDPRTWERQRRRRRRRRSGGRKKRRRRKPTRDVGCEDLRSPAKRNACVRADGTEYLENETTTVRSATARGGPAVDRVNGRSSRRWTTTSLAEGRGAFAPSPRRTVEGTGVAAKIVGVASGGGIEAPPLSSAESSSTSSSPLLAKRRRRHSEFADLPSGRHRRVVAGGTGYRRPSNVLTDAVDGYARSTTFAAGDGSSRSPAATAAIQTANDGAFSDRGLRPPGSATVSTFSEDREASFPPLPVGGDRSRSTVSFSSAAAADQPVGGSAAAEATSGVPRAATNKVSPASAVEARRSSSGVASPSARGGATATAGGGTFPNSATPWVRNFIASRPRDALLHIPREFLADGFNLVHLAPAVERAGADARRKAEVRRRPASGPDDGMGREETSGGNDGGKPMTKYPLFKAALRLILQMDSDSVCEEGLTATMPLPSIPPEVQRAAEALYTLVHARYVASPRGLDAVRRMFLRGKRTQQSLETSSSADRSSESTCSTAVFGRCPRIACRGMPLLPYGESDAYRGGGDGAACSTWAGCDGLTDQSVDTSKKAAMRYCCSCGETLFQWQSQVDGSAWGTSFCHLFLVTYGSDLFTELSPDRAGGCMDEGGANVHRGVRHVFPQPDQRWRAPRAPEAPNIYGFALHHSAKVRYPLLPSSMPND